MCRYEVECASGLRDLGFRCAAGEFEKTVWQLLPEPCAEPYDHCHVEGSGDYYCDETWEPYVGPNPPAVCPETQPSQGDTCPTDPYFGTSREFCGYRCESGAWTVATCTGDIDGQGPSTFTVEDCGE